MVVRALLMRFGFIAHPGFKSPSLRHDLRSCFRRGVRAVARVRAPTGLAHILLTSRPAGTALAAWRAARTAASEMTEPMRSPASRACASRTDRRRCEPVDSKEFEQRCPSLAS